MHLRLIGLVAAYAFGTCWGMAAVAPELVTTLLGDKWLIATLPLTVLAAVAPLRMLSALNNTITSAAGVPQASTIELAVAGLLLPIAVLVGALADGLRGACLAWPVAYPVVYLISNALTCRAVGNSKMRGLMSLGAPLVAGAAMWHMHHGASLAAVGGRAYPSCCSWCKLRSVRSPTSWRCM